MPAFTIRPLTHTDREWVQQKIYKEWGAEIIVVHGDIFRPAELPGFAACRGKQIVGLLTYRVDGDEFEIMTLNSWHERTGVGTSLIDAARYTAIQQGCRRLYLVTTNDNTRALRFYQMCGFTLSVVRLNVIEKSRRIKPEIPPHR